MLIYGTLSNLNGTPEWKTIEQSSEAVAALNGLWCLIDTALTTYMHTDSKIIPLLISFGLRSEERVVIEMRADL